MAGPFHLDKLHIITVISNPIRYESRYKLYRAFAKHVKDSGGILTTVELAFGDRPFEVTDSCNPRHVQLRTFDEVWHKENLINVGLSRLPSDWEYVAWVDADVAFVRPDWVQETIQQLQHYMVCQLFSHAIDLGPAYEPLQIHRGFAFSYHEDIPPTGTPGTPYMPYPGPQGAVWHPGFAWAARREAIDHLGRLIDWGILGSSDHHMAMALIGQVKRSVPAEMSPNYIKLLTQWEERALKYIRYDIGYLPGTVVHFWHGKKRDRKYKERWQILIDYGFDPEIDLKKDSQGIWQLTDRSVKLRDALRKYFRERNEDSVDL